MTNKYDTHTYQSMQNLLCYNTFYLREDKFFFSKTRDPNVEFIYSPKDCDFGCKNIKNIYIYYKIVLLKIALFY